MMWSQSCSILFVAVGLSLLCLWPTQTQGARGFNCRRFCMRTGFRGTVGGCRCQFTLFTNKRSDLGDNRLAKRAFPPLMEEHLDELPQFSDLTKADILARYPARAKLLYPYLAGLQDVADYQDNYDISDILSTSLENEILSSDNTSAEKNTASNLGLTRIANQMAEPKSIMNSSTSQGTANENAAELPEPNQIFISRKELEQQMNNGDNSDYIRLHFN